MDKNNFLENETRQKKVEEFHISKNSVWQGDFSSNLIFGLSKKYLSKRNLDVGAGTGALVKLIRSKGYEIEGIDLLPKNSFIKKGVITDLPFSNFEFGTIFCTEVLEHLTKEQIDVGLKEVSRVIIPGGYFIITTPFNENINHNKYKCPHCEKSFHPFGHLQSFNLEKINTLLKSNGFKIVRRLILPINLMSKLPGSIYYYKILLALINRLDYTKNLFIIAKKIQF